MPGHERFVPNMLAGVGPVPAALIVVAADEGWMPQSAEHLAALDALGVGTACSWSPAATWPIRRPRWRQARAEIAATALGAVEAVAVSGATGAGLDELRAALDRLGAGLPAPDGRRPVRLWVDRSFTIRAPARSSPAPSARAGCAPATSWSSPARRPGARPRPAVAGRSRSEVAAVARVAVNLRGVDQDAVGRGDALLTPGRFHLTDLRRRPGARRPGGRPARHRALHVGSAAVPAGCARSARTPPGCGWPARCRCTSATGRCCATRAGTTSPAA